MQLIRFSEFLSFGLALLSLMVGVIVIFIRLKRFEFLGKVGSVTLVVLAALLGSLSVYSIQLQNETKQSQHEITAVLNIINKLEVELEDNRKTYLKRIEELDKLSVVPEPGTSNSGGDITKQGVVDKIAAETGLNKKDAAEALDAVVIIIREALAKGESVVLIGLGVFDVRTRAAREGRNPQTGEKIIIPEVRIPAFKPSKQLREAVARKRKEE